MTVPSISDVYPAASATGIVIGDTIRVIFDREMDESSINTGTFVITGPDNDFIFGPDINPLEDNPGIEDEDILSSPHMDGYVKGVVTFKRLDSNGNEVTTQDTTGDGTLYRTEATFTPSAVLQPNKTYEILIAGDEDTSDTVSVGVGTRSVFDTIDFSVAGTGQITFGGGYTGSGTRTYVVEITSGGAPGVATYHWYRESDPLNVTNGVTSTGRRVIEDGIYITCDPDGSFITGDVFKVVVKASEKLVSNYSWEFTTGSGAIVTPSSTHSTSGIEEVEASATTSTSTFYVSSTIPTNRQYGVEVSDDSSVDDVVEIIFSIAPSYYSLTGNISVWTEPCNGDDLTINAKGDLDFSYAVNGTSLLITIDQGQIYNNNIVIITLDSDIYSSVGSVELGSDYEFYFSTSYTPLYSSLRRVRLDMGDILVDVPDETVMLAIFEASLQADANSFNSPNTSISSESTTVAGGGTHNYTSYYRMARREYTTCLAELILLRGLMGGSSLSDKMSKTLGDLQVSRGGVRLADRQDTLEQCVARWQVPLQNGGLITPETSLQSKNAVKGSTSEDSIYVGRQWESTRRSGEGYQKSLANDKMSYTDRRWLRTFRRR